MEKLLFVVLIGACLAAPARLYAQEERDCQSTLSDLTWVLQDADQYPQLRSEARGGALIGVRCSEAEIIAWFEENSWTLRRSSSANGQHFGSGSEKYRMDRGLVFCRPQPFLLRWLKGDCAAQASVILYNGRITQVFSGPTK